MRITVVHRYFWPDTVPYGMMLKEIASSWHRAGHSVRVLTSVPASRSRRDITGYTSNLDGLKVSRVPVLRERNQRAGQLGNLFLFPMLVAIQLLFCRRQNLIMCATAPQVTLGFLVSTVARLRRTPFVYHCMDLHPEIGTITGEFANPLVYRVLACLDRITMRRAARIVVLSEDMKQAVIARDPDLAAKTLVVNNFALDGERTDPSPLAPPPRGVLRVVFTGNLGRFQGLESLVEGAVKVRPETAMELVFMGDGKAAQDIERAIHSHTWPPHVQVRMISQGTPGAAQALMQSAHVGIVSLIPRVIRYAYPSKTATYLVNGLPLLVVCEEDSNLAMDVRRYGLGWHVSSDPTAIAGAFDAAFASLNSPAWAACKEAVQDYATQNLSKETLLRWWDDLPLSLANPSEGSST